MSILVVILHYTILLLLLIIMIMCINTQQRWWSFSNCCQYLSIYDEYPLTDMSCSSANSSLNRSIKATYLWCVSDHSMSCCENSSVSQKWTCEVQDDEERKAQGLTQGRVRETRVLWLYGRRHLKIGIWPWRVLTQTVKHKWNHDHPEVDWKQWTEPQQCRKQRTPERQDLHKELGWMWSTVRTFCGCALSGDSFSSRYNERETSLWKGL